MSRVKRECLRCGFFADVLVSEMDMGREVIDCPKCKGAFVDVWRINRYLNNDNKKSRGSLRVKEIEKIIERTKLSLIKNSTLLISLEKEDSVPKVFYKGEEVLLMKNVSFDWETDTDEMGGLTYAIEHHETENGYLVDNRIERRVRGYAGY